MDAFKPLIAKVAAGLPLSGSEAEMAFSQILSGESTPAQTAGFLIALRVRGETVEEITGAVKAMRGKMLAVPPVAGAIDVVGTGGDASGSWNVSTLAGLIVAACGVPVAKHGNRAASSKSGAADILQALGVKIGLTPAEVTNCIAKTGFAFMVAPAHHPAMRHVGPVRTELGTRTIFNLLGPLSNPAGVTRALIGVFSPEWVEPLAHVLKALGMQSAWIVHGDGLDEMTTSGETIVAALAGGAIRRFTLTPEDFGLARVSKDQLKGGDADHNAAALRLVLDGEPGAYRDIVLLNAGSALAMAGLADDVGGGIALAAQSIDSGKARAALDRLVAVSNAA